jgi:integrase
LNPTQIDKLYHHRFEDPKIELIKDYLCLATQTGLRYSDWHKIKFENMIQAKGEWFLDIKKTQKDKKGLRLLCSPLVLEIFKKYRNKLPTVPKYDIVLPGVKVACGILADINASEVGSHIGRRSLATNMYIADPDSIETIRRILGHTSQDMTRKYIQTGLDDMGRMQVEHRDKRKLRIVK